jgi:hypothetical protein
MVTAMGEEQDTHSPQDVEASSTPSSEVSPQDQTAAEPAAADPQLLLSAVSPSRLAAPTSPEAVTSLSQKGWWTVTQKVAFDWQAMSVWADIWELLAPRVQHGRGRELAGLIADGGERLALALAAVTEAELWSIYRQETPPEVRALDEMQKRVVDARNEMAHRAMAELASYYLLATGHILANVTVRALALDSQLHPVLLDILGSWYPAGSSDRNDWLSLNREAVRGLRRAARKASNSAAQGIAEPTSVLLMSPAWQKLDQVRGAQYHRRRPQSAGMDGVPLASPWRFSNGLAHLDGGGGKYADGDGLAHETTDLARRGLAELKSAMQRLLGQVQAVVEEMKSTTNTG